MPFSSYHRKFQVSLCQERTKKIFFLITHNITGANKILVHDQLPYFYRICHINICTNNIVYEKILLHTQTHTLLHTYTHIHTQSTNQGNSRVKIF